MPKILLLCILFFSFSFSASLGEKRIKLLGEKKDNVSKRIKIKDLEKIPNVDFIIKDPYLNKNIKYGGVLLPIFLKKYAKKSVTSVIITAIDDYQIVLTKEDWQNDTIVLVNKYNDNYADYKQRGPLRIIYPNYDPSLPKYKKNLINWIWMIKSIEFK